ncbi:MAG: hypothetical protein U9N57_07310 [Pseudomonadota bacterium]|nr:hypothetical protein [Pseudomonadota bacterium]
MDKQKVLYLPSTPLNILLSVAHAIDNSEEQNAKLVLIDQKTTENNVYLAALTSWESSPFDEVLITSGHHSGRQKLVERKKTLSKLAGLVERFPVDAIAVGSDRRVEFQYMMHLRSQKTEKIEGWYLDDGLYSYAGRPTKWFKDQVSSILKKISYGFWWREPKTVGASSWIHQAWLFRPNQAVPELKLKHPHVIEPDWFTNLEVQQFSKQVCGAFGLDQVRLNILQTIDLFVLIPHPNNLKKMKGYEDRLHNFLKQLHQLGIKVAAKYHPRTDQSDPLGLVQKYDATLVASELAFEFVLPFLKIHSVVVGDIGTALLTAKWLRPDLKTRAILNSESKFEFGFNSFLKKLDIVVNDNFDQLLREKVIEK